MNVVDGVVELILDACYSFPKITVYETKTYPNGIIEEIDSYAWAITALCIADRLPKPLENIQAHACVYLASKFLFDDFYNAAEYAGVKRIDLKQLLTAEKYVFKTLKHHVFVHPEVFEFTKWRMDQRASKIIDDTGHATDLSAVCITKRSS